MKIDIIILMMLLCSEAIAASAHWSGIFLINDGVYSDDLGQYFFDGNIRSEHGNRAAIISTFYGHEENGCFYMKHADFSMESMEPTYNWWAFALCGDIVGEENFSSLKHIEDFYGNDKYTGGALVENPNDFYMAFKVSEVLKDSSGYYAGETWYGWVHVSIDEDLKMTLLGDGINLYGGAVTVGATPEPTSGLLLLVGGALLALRRRREMV